MKAYKFVFTYGFALFGMFFGAGNLVFPLQIGQISGMHWLWGFLGMTITGIILPFLGLFVVKLHRGDYAAFFGNAGTLVRSCLPLLALSLMASFGGMPRCITVAYGGIRYLYPEFSITLFSSIFCAVTFFICLKEQRIISIVGKMLTPILLIFFAVLIISGMIHPLETAMEATMNVVPFKAFCNGLHMGYQTMDLLAAFFFSALIFTQMRKTLPPEISDKEGIKIAIQAGILAIFLLMVIYGGMAFLGKNFAALTANVKPASMLITIANHLLGNSTALCICLIIIIACLTTVVALNNIYAQYLCTLFHLPREQFKFVLLGTTIIAFFVSLFDFDGIARLLVPVLEVSYPSIIILTLISVFYRKPHRIKIMSFYSVLAIALLCRIAG
ncbi:MAG: branched-chain amino acid transport system II carrier protein [Puniceicoccales bacterium]|jgi:LIVCS family branched-chain amino acid:cation transporter|nr:branched-chain amino acid transport system II carrier protein [Puniceicoccales bacterium]